MASPNIGDKVLYRTAPEEVLQTDENGFLNAVVKAVHYTGPEFASVNLDVQTLTGTTEVRHSIRLISRSPKQQEPRPYAVLLPGQGQAECAETITTQTPQEAHEAYTGPSKETVVGPEVSAEVAEPSESDPGQLPLPEPTEASEPTAEPPVSPPESPAVAE